MVIDLTSSPIKKDLGHGSDNDLKKEDLYRNSFVACIGLEIYETVYGQTSQFVAAGLLVTMSKKPTLHPY